jgi:hypothetical protein
VSPELKAKDLKHRVGEAEAIALARRFRNHANPGTDRSQFWARVLVALYGLECGR